MILQISAASYVGCVRENNEDMILVEHQFVRNGDYRLSFDIGNQNRLLIALADGMGGHNSGEVASQDVLNNLHYFFNDLPAGFDSSHFNEAIFEWLASINHIIDSKGRSNPQYHDMGTTLVAVAFYEGEVYWMNCGDSRLYQCVGDVMQQLTTDHSLSNLIGEREHSSIITNCIGGGCRTSFIDIMRFTSDVQPGDTLLLCSDGLTDMISNSEIRQLLKDGADAKQLCDAAIAAGGYDNVSASVIRIEE